MPPNRFESEVESFLEGSHGDRTHIKRADHPRLHHYAGRYSFLSATCLHLPPTFLLLVLPFCRLLGGFLYISCLSVSPAFCNLRRGSSEPCRGGASGRLMGGGSLLPLPGCLRWIFRPLETPLETSSRNFIEPS